jgi:hypothetical protein
MKKIIQFAFYSIAIFLFSCQKDISPLSPQKVELDFYAFENSATPVNIRWNSQTAGFCEKKFSSSCTEKFYINQEDTLRIQIIPEKENSFLNIYFKLIINDVTVRTVKLYNDAEINTDSAELIYYKRSFEKYNVRFAHDSNDENDYFPYQLSYCVNDSVRSTFQKYAFDAEPGDVVSSKVIFKIPTSEQGKQVFHKTIITVNGEIVRYDYIQRCSCGNHSSEMTLAIEPYL